MTWNTLTSFAVGKTRASGLCINNWSHPAMRTLFHTCACLLAAILIASTTVPPTIEAAEVDRALLRIKLLQKYPPFNQRARELNIKFEEDLKLASTLPLLADEVAFLATKGPRFGGLNAEEKLLCQLTCQVVYQAQTPVEAKASGNSFTVKQYNMLGIPIAETTHHINRNGVRRSSFLTAQRMILTLEDRGEISFRADYTFVEPAVFLGPILKKPQCQRVIEQSGLEPQLRNAINQVLILNGAVHKGDMIPHSTIRDGLLVPMRPGYALTPTRLMDFSVDADGKVTASLEIKKSSDRQKLKDAHEGKGDYQNVQGVPVGQILPSAE